MPGAISWLMPKVRLSDAAFRSRHRALTVVLWLHAPVLVVLAVVNGHAVVGKHAHGAAWLVWCFIAGAVLCALVAGIARTRRGGSGAVSIGLLLAAMALVHAGNGLTDLHFHFFVVLGLISLYQDWLPLFLGILIVGVHHLVIGMTMPETPQALAHPVWFSLLHIVFVVAMCATQLTYWRFAAAAETEADIERERLATDNQEQLRAAADNANQREESAAANTAEQVARSEQLGRRLETVLADVAAAGVRLGAEAGSATRPARRRGQLGEGPTRQRRANSARRRRQRRPNLLDQPRHLKRNLPHITPRLHHRRQARQRVALPEGHHEQQAAPHLDDSAHHRPGLGRSRETLGQRNDPRDHRRQLVGTLRRQLARRRHEKAVARHGDGVAHPGDTLCEAAQQPVQPRGRCHAEDRPSVACW